MDDGSSVLVAAPTGAGKTVVGEFAAWLALEGGGKTFYTTPIKALSNQKYNDFLALHGAANVGLLTGDNSINGSAPIVVMTTEVLRNMIYEASSDLTGLRYVVLDEVHYLQNPYRGGVWEEVLIHLPIDVQTISLSATVSNAEEFAEWLQTLRGTVEVIIEEKRPVELRHWYLTSEELLPMFVASSDGALVPNPQARASERRRHRDHRRPARGGGRPRGSSRARIPYRAEVIEQLDQESMLPAIYFIFSRKGCDDAVRQCLRENVRLTTEEEAAQIVEFAQLRVTDLAPDELDVLGYDDWITGLERGIAAHHAGMIPPFKEAVEELFTRGLVKAVFATETLALGINMPARSVVIESLMKFTGEKHERLKPGEYTQLAGRAGRRGIDDVGHCVVLTQRFIRFDEITTLASTRTYPLQSSFHPSYNMAVNLVRNYERSDAEHLVNSSFAQFQADRDVVRLERVREQDEAYLASYRERMHCELGDVEEYGRLRDRLEQLEKWQVSRTGNARIAAVADAMHELRPGDVIYFPHGKRRGRYAVVEVAQKRSERFPKLIVVTAERSITSFLPGDFRDPPVAAAHITLPKSFNIRNTRSRREVAHNLGRVTVRQAPREKRTPEETDELRSLRRSVERHPVHKCPDLTRHLYYARQAERVEDSLRRIEKRIGRRSGTLARRFQRVLEVLQELGYVEGWMLTSKGELLTRVYNEADLLVVESLERDLFGGLVAPELSAVLSTLVYETRGPETDVRVDLPNSSTARSFRQLMKMWRHIHREEDARGLQLTREPDPGFAERAYLWASDVPLEEVLGPEDAPGDFVRSVKQLVDLLRQLEEIAPDQQLTDKLRTAIDALHRGVVAYSSVGP